MFRSNADTFIILANSDVPHQDTVILDSDCAPAAPPTLDSDCACAEAGFTFENISSQPVAEVPYIKPSLHTNQLKDGFGLAFNPLSQAGVVVLNEPAHHLLNNFHTARTLAEGAAVAGNIEEGLRAAQQLASFRLLEPVGTSHRPRQAQPETLTVWFHVTNQCNLRCPYCYIHKSPDKMELERGIQSVKAVFRSARANGFHRVKLKYAGGESSLNFPLVLALHEHTEQLATREGIVVDGVVLSNGVAWGHRMIEALQERGLRLMLSLDGIGEYHDAQRPFINGQGSWHHVERTLDRLEAHGVRPSVSITLSQRNLAGLPEVVEYMLQRGLPFTLNFYRENECSSSITDLRYQEDEIIEAMRTAFSVIERNLPPYSLLGALVDRARLDVAHNRPCGVGQSYLVIDQHGGVAKCQMEIEQTITDISVSDPLQVLRDDRTGIQNHSVDNKEGCRECTWRYWCAGGCPALTYRATGRYDVKSPNCRIYKTLFPDVLRLEGLRLLKYGGAQVT